jgi:hypothetical protein
MMLGWLKAILSLYRGFLVTGRGTLERVDVVQSVRKGKRRVDLMFLFLLHVNVDVK